VQVAVKYPPYRDMTIRHVAPDFVTCDLLAQVGVKRDLTIFRGKARYIALDRDAQPLQSGAIFGGVTQYVAPSYQYKCGTRCMRVVAGNGTIILKVKRNVRTTWTS
jgi:hypothetical protein